MREERRERTREGEVLAGKYKLERRLGTGGMGEVYRATNTVLGRPVAIKVLLAVHAGNDTIIKRVLTEARAAAIVRHPNVVDVLDIGQDAQGLPFIVQELLEGKDLSHRLRDAGGKLSAREAVEILLPVIDAMGVAHAKGVVHRDLKPANVFLANVGGEVVPKLLDFGISLTGDGNQRLTSTGMSMGTPAYMSPEQIMASRTVDARSDVWAFGVLLYELVSGKLPFFAEASSAIFVMISTKEPTPIEDEVPDVPRDLARIIRKCMRKSRTGRYATAGELAKDLRAFLSGRSPTAASEPEPPPDLNVPTPALSISVPPPPPEPARPSLRRVRDVGGFVDLAGDVGTGSGLRVATVHPPRLTSSPDIVLPPPEAEGEGVVRAVTRGVVLGVVVVAVGGVLAVVNPARDGWPIVSFVNGLIASVLGDGAPALPAGVAYVVALSCLVAPVFALRRAWQAWSSDRPGARARGALFAAVAAVAFFAAIQIFRGEGQGP